MISIGKNEKSASSGLRVLDKACEKVDIALNGSKLTYIVIYSCLFVPFFALFSSSCWISGRSFIWWVDGLEQQYPFFIL